MIDMLKFVFSGFWTWLGTVILLGIVVQGAVTIAACAAAAFANGKPRPSSHGPDHVTPRE